MTCLHQPAPTIGQRPFICVPLLADTLVTLGTRLTEVVAQTPDLMEWRMDYLTPINNVAALAGIDLIRAHAPQLPLIVSFRAAEQGGHANNLSPEQIFELLVQVCMQGKVDYIDYEITHTQNEIEILRRLSQHHQVGLILSHHDFTATPPDEALREMLLRAYQYEADVVKLAVMPQSASDVMRVLRLTAELRQGLDLPFITMAMGELGAFSRLVGGHYGSCVSFASVEGRHSAPGQWSLDDTREAIKRLYPAQFE